MKLLLTALLCFTTHTLYAQIISKENSSIICWQENIKLRWQDFQAKLNPYGKDSTIAANAAPEIKIIGFVDEKGKNNYKVTCTFRCTSAWVRDTTYLLAIEVLAHEQLHFDLAELITRRIRMKLAKSYKEGKDLFSLDIRQLIQSLLTEHDELQDLYDKETDNGLSVAQQKKWSVLVSSQLFKLKIYQSTALTCNN